ASYVIILIQEYVVGHKFTNYQLIPSLPPPAHKDKSIDWRKGLLKGLVQNIHQPSYDIDENGEERRETTYENVKTVDKELLDKVKKNVDEEWLKKVMEKKKK